MKGRRKGGREAGAARQHALILPPRAHPAAADAACSPRPSHPLTHAPTHPPPVAGAEVAGYYLPDGSANANDIPGGEEAVNAEEGTVRLADTAASRDTEGGWVALACGVVR